MVQKHYKYFVRNRVKMQENNFATIQILGAGRDDSAPPVRRQGQFGAELSYDVSAPETSVMIFGLGFTWPVRVMCLVRL